MDAPPAVPRATHRHRKRLRRTAFVAILLLLALVADYYAYPYGLPPPGQSGNRGENGLWLRYTWYFGQKSEAELRELSARLKQTQTHYAYFHVRGILKNGTLGHKRRDEARRLLIALRRDAPGVKLLAWVYAGNKQGRGEVELSQPVVRRAMVAEALWLVQECGFDGVQWDYEICTDGDPHFLALMRETRTALPPGKLLGTATPMWLPPPLGTWGWSEGYFAQVAATCDQIAVMCYDSGFYLPRSYAWLVSKQIVHVTQAVSKGNSACRVLLGVPTYGPGFLSHNPRAENIGIALRGVRAGLATG